MNLINENWQIISSYDSSKIWHKLTFLLCISSYDTLSSPLLSGLCWSEVEYFQILAFKNIYSETLSEKLFQIFWRDMCVVKDDITQETADVWKPHL